MLQVITLVTTQKQCKKHKKPAVTIVKKTHEGSVQY